MLSRLKIVFAVLAVAAFCSISFAQNAAIQNAVRTGINVASSQAGSSLLQSARSAGIITMAQYRAALQGSEEAIMAAINAIEASSNSNLKNQLNNFSRAVELATVQVKTSGVSADAAANELLTAAALENPTRAQQQAEAAAVAATLNSLSRAEKLGWNRMLNSLERDLIQRASNSNDPELERVTRDAIAKLKRVVDQGIGPILADGAKKCVLEWGSELNEQIKTLLLSASAVSVSAKSYAEAKSQFAAVLKARTNKSDAKVEESIRTLADPNECNIIVQAMARG